MKQLSKKFRPVFMFGFDKWTYDHVDLPPRWAFRFHKDNDFQYIIEEIRDRIKEKLKDETNRH